MYTSVLPEVPASKQANMHLKHYQYFPLPRGWFCSISLIVKVWIAGPAQGARDGDCAKAEHCGTQGDSCPRDLRCRERIDCRNISSKQ